MSNHAVSVSLFTREWIEIASLLLSVTLPAVSLFTREWIEIRSLPHLGQSPAAVSLFTREWIEIGCIELLQGRGLRLPLYEGVD